MNDHAPRALRIELDEGADPVKDQPVSEWFSRAARKVAEIAGRPWTFAVGVALVVGWAATGPLFGFSNTWQLAINSTTTIVTFLMVFLIQTTQNKDTQVIHVKLNELIASQTGASNHLIDLEDMSDADLERLRIAFQRLADRADEKEAHGRMTVEQVVHGIYDEEQTRGRSGKRKGHARGS